MVEEETLSCVQHRDIGHVFRTQLKVEDVEVLGDALLANRLRNRHDTALSQPAQDHLSDTFVVLVCDRE